MKTRKRKWKGVLKGALLLLYLVCLLSLTFLGREPEPERMAWTVFFGSFRRAWDEQHTFIFWGIVVNFMMLLPFGLLLPWGSSRCGVGRTALAALLLSVSIECIQYITRLGYFDVDDIITNVWGAAAGAGFYQSIKKLIQATERGQNPKWWEIICGLVPLGFFFAFFLYFLFRMKSST